MATENYYSSESELKAPFALLKSIASELPVTARLSIKLFYRDFIGQHRETLMGITWAILPMLLLAGIFIGAVNAKILNVSSSIPYPAFIIIGTILWQAFTDCLHAPILSIEKNRSLLSKINFPPESLVFAKIFEAIFNFAVKSLILVGLFIYYGLEATPQLLLFPLGVVSIMIMGLTVGIILTPMALIFQDISKGLQLIMPILMFLSPVVYETPEAGALGTISKLNPLNTALNFSRNALVGGPIEYWPQWLAITCSCFLILCYGFLVLRVSVTTINERSGN